MDSWFWLKLFVALLGYGIAAAIFALENCKAFQSKYVGRFAWVRVVLFVALAVGIVVTPFLVWHEHQAGKKTSDQLDDISATVKDVAAVVGAPVENVVKAVADLKSKVDGQETTIKEQAAKIEGTQGSLDEMKRRAAPRTFSEREAAAIKKVLSASPQKGPVKLWLPTTDEETVAYGLQLEAIFAAAGWKVTRAYGTYRSGSPPSVFVLHFLKRPVPPGHPAVAVSKALEAAGIKYGVMVKELNVEADGLVIHLPPKPKL